MRSLLALPLLLAATAAAAETPATLPRLPDPVGLARLVRPDGPAPLVVILPDSLGEDGRSEPYVDSLLARGIATLVLGLGEDLETPGTPVEPAASPEAVPPALAWAAAAGFAPVGLLGFGLGGRAALAAGAGLPAVALYPVCDGLRLPEAGPALVMQGGEDAAGCAALPARPGVELRLVTGAGHAWDAPGAIRPSPGPGLPDPAGGGLRRARADLQVTLDVAEAVAEWFAALLVAPHRSAAR